MSTLRSGDGAVEQRVRLFVALDLPESIRSSLVRWRDGVLAGRDELRAVAPEALHVTLCFLGWRPESAVPAVADAVAAACDGRASPTLVPTGVVAVPPRRSRLFALDLADREDRATAVQAAVSDALAAAGLYEPEARPFWPHVTFARVRRGVRPEPLDGPPPPGEAFSAREVLVYRSTLRPQGALYEPLARVSLADD